MKQMLLIQPANIAWLFKTHLKGKSDSLKERNCTAALITGNEDCPNKIELYYATPKHTFKPRHTLVLEPETGNYIKEKK